MLSSAARQDVELVELVTQLVACPSFSGAEAAVQARIVAWFAENGVEAVAEPADGGLQNIVVVIEGEGDGPTLWIGGHCDTVSVASGWTHAPHRPRLEAGRLHGLGAMDMKAGLATAMIVARDLRRRRADWGGRLIFAALADEEAHSRGASAFVRTERRIDAAIMCEPHFDDVVIGALGKINLTVEVTGKSAHGSRPEAGVNAVTEAARLIVAIDRWERPPHADFGRASPCVLNVSSGDGAYEIRVPERCRFTINWHLLPDETPEAAVALLQRLAADLHSAARFAISVGEPRYDSFWLGREHPFVQAFAARYRAVLGKAPDLAFGRGVSDANIFAGRAGIPTLLFGPSGANMHSADEWVDLSQLEQARAVLEDFALHFLRPVAGGARP